MKNNIELRSIGANAYIPAVNAAFGAGVDYGQIVKEFAVPMAEGAENVLRPVLNYKPVSPEACEKLQEMGSIKDKIEDAFYGLIISLNTRLKKWLDKKVSERNQRRYEKFWAESKWTSPNQLVELMRNAPVNNHMWKLGRTGNGHSSMSVGGQGVTGSQRLR